MILQAYIVGTRRRRFGCVLNLQGFSSANWPRRLQLETMMPEFQPRSTLSDSNVQKWLKQLDQDGLLNLSTLGDISLVQRKQLLSEILSVELSIIQ